MEQLLAPLVIQSLDVAALLDHVYCSVFTGSTEKAVTQRSHSECRHLDYTDRPESGESKSITHAAHVGL